VFYSSFGFERHYHHYHQDRYSRRGKGYFPEEFKKEKPPTFDGEMKKLEDAEA